MEMTLRWYGPGYDSVTLEQIRQIPGVHGVVTTLFGKQAGEVWTAEEIADLKKTVEDAGLKIAAIESVNVSDDIKIGTARRDEHIANYITTLENLAKNIAYKVKRTKRPVSLEPMNPYERRIIHSALQSDPYVTTHSEGEDPYRKVVVTLKR